MKTTIEYDENIKKNFHDTSYYESQEFNIKNLGFLEEEKNKHKTEDKQKVISKIQYLLGKVGKQDKVFEVLEKIYIRNQRYAFGKEPRGPKNENLLNLLADESLLMVAYNKVRKNKRSGTEAYDMSDEKYNNLSDKEKSWVNKTNYYTDEINSEVFKQTSKIIKSNKYPWGANKHIYVYKSGKKGAKRPITIPSFMDKVIQEAINILLKCIYEPYFEALNSSFGFRPNKGVHDAIIALTNADAIGLNMALEGEIKFVYDRVSRERFIEILGKRIGDNKFLKFMKKRLNYQFYDTKEKEYINLNDQLLQEGIDSPYLWNIYMLHFDEYILSSLKQYCNKLNFKGKSEKSSNSRKNIISKERRQNERKRITLNKINEWTKGLKNEQETVIEFEKLSGKTSKEIKSEKILTEELLSLKKILKEINIGNTEELSQIKKNIVKNGKKLYKEEYKVRDTNKIRLRFIYVRYADDWVILTNMKKYMIEFCKEKIKNFLHEELMAELSVEKTLLTDIREKPAHFLGYKISTYKGKNFGVYKEKINGKVKRIKAVLPGSKVFAKPDTERIFNRLHIKGYCDKYGFPREIGFLSNLDDFMIIERYNAVLRGMSDYYVEFIRNPRTNMSRWFYIIRYSCIKTLAQKHKTTVRKIFKNYSAPIGKNLKSREKTIEIIVINKIGDDTYKKTWTLLTPENLIQQSLSLKLKEMLTDRFWTLNKGVSITYKDKGEHAITNDNFYDKLKWINIRTQSSFDLPCAICGLEKNIEMHHLKHIRKNHYEMDNIQTWKQAMYLRNRKQIPICRECHVNVIYRGTYGGTKLAHFSPKVMYDNRIITIESHLNKQALSKEKINLHRKTLEEKGWIKEYESKRNREDSYCIKKIF